MHWLARLLSLAPRPTKTPTGALHLSTFELRSDDEVLIGRRDIEARPIIGECMAFIFDAERFEDIICVLAFTQRLVSPIPRRLCLR